MGFTEDQTYMYFVQRMQNYTLKHDRDPVNWEEVYNHFGTKMHPSSIVHIWLAGGAKVAQVVADGFRVLYSAHSDWYVAGVHALHAQHAHRLSATQVLGWSCNHLAAHVRHRACPECVQGA